MENWQTNCLDVGQKPLLISWVSKISILRHSVMLEPPLGFEHSIQRFLRRLPNRG
jgi:hypothetical protein